MICVFFLYPQDWIGPDLPLSELACTVCQTSCVLICQIYAPLENSSYHRSLYIFACIQPACWNQVQSWKCFRGQVNAAEAKFDTSTEPNNTKLTNTFDWGTSEDDGGWGSPEEDQDANLTSQLGALSMDPGTSEEFCKYILIATFFFAEGPEK